MKLVTLFLALWLVKPALHAATVITFNGAVTNQVIDGFGVNANYRSWTNDELKPVLDTLIDQAGMTLFRVVYDNANWEATNDSADSTVMDWTYYNSVYSSTEFTKMWDMVAYLNGRGITTNGIIFNFMGPGPSWMGGGSLASGKEDEWAEMIASLLVYARNTMGLQFQFVGPDNEPDIPNEGISISTASQYTNALHKLAVKLDANGLSDVRFVAPDLAGGGTTYMPQILADPVIMAKLGHFSVHSYSDGGGSGGVYNFLKASAYPDRTLWTTEFNVWCSTCDSGIRGTYDWTYCKGTAEYLMQQLLNNASAGIVWEGYDSYYLHPPTAWSFWGLLSVDNENAPVKKYTPRKNFYTFSQISKWVRPGARRIGVSGSTGSFSPLLAFKHPELGQITIVGINTSSSSGVLSGTLASLPAVTRLDLYYTSANTNLALGGSVSVSNGAFNATIPADCVFTLTGFSGVKLTNGIPCTNSIQGSQRTENYYLYTVTNPVARVQFEILNPSRDLTLVARKGALPQFGSNVFDYLSDNPGTNDEFILVLTNSSPVPVSAGDWFLAVVNNSGAAASFAIEATQWPESGQPISLLAPDLQDNTLCLTWNSLTGARYVVQGKASLNDPGWTDASPTITGADTTTGYCEQLPSPFSFFRVIEGVAIDNGVARYRKL